MSDWQYAPAIMGNQNVVRRTLLNGNEESCLISREDVQKYIAEGNIILPAEESNGG